MSGGPFGQIDVIDDGLGYVVDDGRIATLGTFDPELGFVIQRPAAASAEEKREVEISGWKVALESVERRIASFDPIGNLMPWEDVPSVEKIERLRAGLEAERQHCLDRLAELEATEPAETKRGRRR